MQTDQGYLLVIGGDDAGLVPADCAVEIARAERDATGLEVTLRDATSDSVVKTFRAKRARRGA